MRADLLSQRSLCLARSIFLTIVIQGIDVFSCSNPGQAQSSSNPDISVIPRFRLESTNPSRESGEEDWSRPEFTLQEFELGIQSYLNPYVRADFFLTKEGVDDSAVEIEEGYASFVRGLPFGLNVQIGKYKTEYGKLNTLHPHAWPFNTVPQSTERFLGEEGLSDLGFSISEIIPTGDVVYTRLTLDTQTGNAIGTLDPGQYSGGIGIAYEDKHYYTHSGRLTTFFPVSENSDLELGLSGLTGIHDPVNKNRFYYGNFDFKYKWKPNAYKSLTIQGEALFNKRKFRPAVERVYNISSAGYYIFCDYQFYKIFSVGGRLDWSQAPYSSDDTAKGIALFCGFYPVEETSAFRLLYQRMKFDPRDGIPYMEHMLALEFLFSMGPHKAHAF